MQACSGGTANITITVVIRFSLFKVPINIHPSLWLTLVLFGAVFRIGGGMLPLDIALFVVAAFTCLLAHEMGHALVGRFFGGGQPDVYLTWLGGDCCNEKAVLTRLQGVVMTASGPLASLAVGAAAALAMGGYMGNLEEGGLLALHVMVGRFPAGSESLFSSMPLALLAYLIQVSFWLSALNLLPVFPLDGGQIMSGLMSSPHTMHRISMISAIVLIFLFLSLDMLLVAVLMLLLARLNYYGLQQTRC